MSLTQEQYRNSLLKTIAESYKQIKAIENMANQPLLNREYKDKKCKRALAQAEVQDGLRKDMAKEEQRLWNAWSHLPEIYRGPDDDRKHSMGPALAFARELTRPKPRRKKYLKTQRKLVEDV